MSREFAKILPSFWTGETGKKIKALGPECIAVALYLLSSPHSTAYGLYHLPMTYLVTDTGMEALDIDGVLRLLSGIEFCRYDWATETVWVPEMGRYQIGDSLKASDKKVKWLTKDIERMRKRPFFNDLLGRYRSVFHLPNHPESNGQTKGLPDCREGASESDGRGISLETERETEKEQPRQVAAASVTAPSPDTHAPRPAWDAAMRGPDALTVACLAAFDEGYATEAPGKRPLGVRHKSTDLGTLVADAAAMGDAVAIFRAAGAEVARRVVASRQTEFKISHPWRVFTSSPIGTWLGEPDAPVADPNATDTVTEIEIRLRAARDRAQALAGLEGVTEARALVESIRAELRRANAERDRGAA